MAAGAGFGWLCVVATFALSLSATARAADDSKSTSNQPAKLTWHAVRPVRSDAQSTQPDKDQAIQSAKYEQDVFDDDKPADKKSTSKQTSSARILLTAGQSNETYSVKARKAAASNSDDVDTLPPPATRELPPPLRVDSEPTQREPMELSPSEPFRPGMKPTFRTFQSQTPPVAPPPVPQPEMQPSPPDTLQGIEAQPTRPERGPEEDCHEEYDRVRKYTLEKLHLDIAPPKDVKSSDPNAPNVPYECSLGQDAFTPRCWQGTTFTWKASALCHKPLYFEEVAMERYGHSHGPVCEDVTSFVHFFGNFALLPYWVGVDTPCECIYDLGYYRPGNCAPYMFDPFPISCRGMVTGGAGYCGVIALFP
jgi:hypothetical protein